MEAEVQQAGFPPLDWYDILLELDRAGGAGLRPVELREKVGVAQYNLSRLMDRMIKAGMVNKLPCEDDRRGHVLTINETGRTTLRRMWPVYSSAIQRHLGVKLTEDDLQMLALLLGKLTAG
ncbi:MAG: MarR family winged helix-turn-helix transcriptional regulator [Pseudomonadota bacterium]